MSGSHYHVAGVAGVGMSAVAQALLCAGHEVSGSDRYLDQGHPLEVLNTLAAAGVKLVKQDGASLTPRTSGLVVSTAIEPDNPEITAARTLGVPVIHRAEMLAQLAKGRRVLAVTGTSGKTTVTGLIGYLLEALGRDPPVINGGVVLDWVGPARVGNVRWGRSDLWVVEADESDKSLLYFDPEWAVITNISKDHFELDEVTDLFRQFEARVKKGVVRDEAFEPRRDGAAWCFDYKEITFRVPLIGRHNAENAFTAVRACEMLGLDLAAVRDALTGFRGIQRRLERVGEARGVTVIDDYAHNPAKIAASWTAVAETAPRIIGFWRPHGYGPLALMQDELEDTFVHVCRSDDRLYILPVFYVGGTANKSVTSEDFALRLQKRGMNVEAVQGYSALRDRVLAFAQPGSAVLGMGARDPELPAFARKMVDALSTRARP